MKFILSFLIATTILSADTCFKLSLGNAALTQEKLCTPSNNLTPPSPVLCQPVAPPIPVAPVIKCNVPTITPPQPIDVSKCTPAPVICPPPANPPVIQCPGPGNHGSVPPQCPPGPNSAAPEPASYALLGAGLMTAGIARRFRNKK